MSVPLRYAYINDKKGKCKCSSLSCNIVFCSERKIFIMIYKCEINFLY